MTESSFFSSTMSSFCSQQRWPENKNKNIRNVEKVHIKILHLRRNTVSDELIESGANLTQLSGTLLLHAGVCCLIELHLPVQVLDRLGSREEVGGHIAGLHHQDCSPQIPVNLLSFSGGWERRKHPSLLANLGMSMLVSSMVGTGTISAKHSQAPLTSTSSGHISKVFNIEMSEI